MAVPSSDATKRAAYNAMRLRIPKRKIIDKRFAISYTHPRLIQVAAISTVRAGELSKRTKSFETAQTMSKPRWSWKWVSLQGWHLGRRRHGKGIARKNRPLRMESLNARIVLAADVVELAPAETDQAAEVAIISSEMVTGDAKTSAESEVANELGARVSQYDVNGHGVVSPIDVLLLINHTQDATTKGATVEAVSMLDVNQTCSQTASENRTSVLPQTAASVKLKAMEERVWLSHNVLEQRSISTRDDDR